MSFRSLEKRSVDSLIDQLLAGMGGDTRIIGPGASFSPLDGKYVGVLKQLLVASIPGIPEQLLSSVRDDLIVVTRIREEPSALVGFMPSTLRVAKPYQGKMGEIKKYADLLDVTVQPTRYVDTDLSDPSIQFHEGFFARRSIKGWAKLSLYFARLCESMQELSKSAGLKQKNVFHGGSDTTLVYAQFVDHHGEEMELTS